MNELCVIFLFLILMWRFFKAMKGDGYERRVLYNE